MKSLILEDYLGLDHIAVKKMNKRNFEIVMANYIDIEVSRQILPLLLTYGWWIIFQPLVVSMQSSVGLKKINFQRQALLKLGHLVP